MDKFDLIKQGQRLYSLRSGKLNESTGKAFTQEALCDVMDVSIPTYRTWEQGKVPIPSQHAFALAEFYGCSTDYILGRTDERNIGDNDFSLLTGLSAGAITALRKVKAEDPDGDLLRGLNFILIDVLVYQSNTGRPSSGESLLELLERYFTPIFGEPADKAEADQELKINGRSAVLRQAATKIDIDKRSRKLAVKQEVNYMLKVIGDDGGTYDLNLNELFSQRLQNRIFVELERLKEENSDTSDYQRILGGDTDVY